MIEYYDLTLFYLLMNFYENLFDKALMLAVYHISWKKGDEKVITYIYVLFSSSVGVFFARFVAVSCTAIIYCGIKYIYINLRILRWKHHVCSTAC